MRWVANGGDDMSIICRYKHKCAKKRVIVGYLNQELAFVMGVLITVDVLRRVTIVFSPF